MTIIWIFFFVKLKKFGCFSAVFDMFDDVFEIDFDDREIFENREKSNVICFSFSESSFDFDESDRFVKYDNWDNRNDCNEWKKSKNDIVKIEFWKFFSFWTRKFDINEKIDFCCDVSRNLNNFKNFFDFQLLIFFWCWRCDKRFCSINFTIFELFENKKSFTTKKSVWISELFARIDRK